MPMRSQAQWAYLFANKMPFAKKWAHATPGGKKKRFQQLPVKVKGYDAKAGQQIAGALYRGQDGKFHAGGSADDQAKATIAQNKKLNAAAPKKGKGGKGKKAGGKGKAPKKVKVAKPTITPEQKAAEKLAKQQANRDAVKKAMMNADAALSPTGLDNVMKLAQGQVLDPKTSDDLVKLGMLRKRTDGSYAMTTSAHAVVRAANTGDAATAVAVANSAAQNAPKTTKSVRITRPATVDMPVLSATTYKSATGQRRWLFVSSTAYQDRDGETVTTKALRKAVDLADQTGYRGNLRYWHLPSHLGDCDWQMVSEDGTLLYESGSFASDGIADWYEANKEQYLLSIGFRHPVSEPLPDKSFENVFIFERSLLPIQYASNLFTGKVQ